MPLKTQTDTKRVRNLGIFGVCVLAWFVLDRLTKWLIDTHFDTGDIILRPIAHLFQLRLVHNTGAAWGSFADATTLIALFSFVMCVVLIGCALYFSKQARTVEMIALALIVAGGLGNLFDRVSQGYVVDFIEVTFIDFPVFNVADIGVTCGMIALVLCVVIRTCKEDSHHGS